MIQLRLSQERGFADHGWLVARHSFSFADYVDPAQMGWGVLRVINEDRVAPGMGFAMHAHRDMEIVTYVLSGTLAHRDSLGHRGQIGPGEVQRMSAGSGIYHSELNPSLDAETHLLQIWVKPAQPGGAASYEQAVLSAAQAPGERVLLVSPDGRAGSLRWGQDALLYASVLPNDACLQWSLAPNRLAYLHLIRGRLTLNGVSLSGGDAAKIADEPSLSVQAQEACEFLYFDLPPQT